MEQTKKAVSYCRVSTEEQAKSGYSLNSQKENCSRHASQQGYIIVKEFIEEGVSAKTLDRPALNKLKDFIKDKKNEISALIIYKIDRLSRNTEDFLYFDNWLRTNKIQLVSVTENIDDTSMGKLMKTLLSGIAKFDNDERALKTSEGMRQAVREGRWLWAPKGYSFQADSYNKRIMVPNTEAPCVQKMFNLLNEGSNMNEIRRKLLQEDKFIISKQGVGEILKNPVYCGLLPDKYSMNNSEYIKGIHTPLISEELFFLVQEKIHKRSYNLDIPKFKINPVFPLRQFMFCSVCGSKMSASISKGKIHSNGLRTLVPYYHCLKTGCHRFHKDDVEDSYFNFLKEIKVPENLLNLFKEIVIDKFEELTSNKKRLITMAEKEIEILQNQKTKIILMMADATISKEDGQNIVEDLNNKIIEKKNIIVSSSSSSQIPVYWQYAKHFMCNMDKLWKKSDILFKQKIQNLVTPYGFKYIEGFIEPIKLPYFLSVFCDNNSIRQAWGG